MQSIYTAQLIRPTTVRILNLYIRLPLLVLGLSEITCLYLSIGTAAIVSSWLGIARAAQFAGSDNQASAIYTTVVFFSLVAFGLYQFHQRGSYTYILARVLVAFLTALLVLATVYHFALQSEVPLVQFAIATIIALPAVGFVRYIFVRTIDNNIFRHNTLIFGAGEQALSVAKLRRKADRRGFKICGFVVSNPGLNSIENSEPGAILLERNKTLFQLAIDTNADEIVIALDERRGRLPVDELLECRLNGIAILELPTFLERETGKVHTDLLSSSSWLVYSSGFSLGFTRRAVKRATDILAALVGLVLASPFMVAAALAIAIESRFVKPIFYRQVRVGLHGKPFTLIKFRSMQVDAEADGQARWASENDSRVTRVGRVIRQTRIDESPQLINVLLGQMSIVGPRPERLEFVKELTKQIPYYQVRHAVKPGITGWAQMKYSYGASIEESAEKLRYDLYYVKYHSLFLDIAIILQTLEIVIFGKGAR